MAQVRYWFEDVPEKDRFWFLVPAADAPPAHDTEKESTDPMIREANQRLRRMWEVGYIPAGLDAAENAWVHDPVEAREYLEIPQLYTTRNTAEEALRLIEEGEADNYLDMVERYGQEETDRALDNTLSLKVLWQDRDTLTEQLEESERLCVRVDEQIMFERTS